MKHLFKIRFWGILLITISLFIGSVSFNAPHPIHISVADIYYKAKSNRIEIAIKIFADDLELGIEDFSEKKIKLVKNQETTNANTAIEKYIQEHFQINTNNTLALRFLGKEYQDDAIWCYLEGTIKTSNIKTIEIYNSILKPFYDDQKNIIHFHKEKQHYKSFILNQNQTDATVNL